ncbi:hypothetical protein LBMAG48_28520 [Phycisphaerae bacterium]|nr:hypothetical protein LBMAG48_28520 [Phycisphaerae bacterium]
MRIFWALIALLILLAAAAMFFTSSKPPRIAPPNTPATTPTPPTAPAPAPTADSAPQAVAPTAPTPAPAPTTPTTPTSTPADLAAAADAEQAILDSIAAKHSGPQHAAKTTKPSITDGKEKPTVATDKTAAATTPTTPPTRAPAKIGEYTVTGATFRNRDDGALVVDEKYIIRGEGTQAKPYVVSWEMLVASEGDFDPSKGKNTIPERVAMLHDKVVTITGYIAFPLMTPKPTELLMMLNQWDGCCMGVPPTPYDAIEVKINKPVSGDARFAINGTVRGTFKVEPYVTKTPTVSWLNGLYLMENAEFAAADIGAGAGS